MDIIEESKPVEELKPVKKYAHRYAYLNAYARNRYHTDPEYRLAKIAKVRLNFKKRQDKLDLSLRDTSLQLVYNVSN